MPKKEKLPCGCEMWREGTIFYMKPHALDCEYYLYAIEASKKRGNAIVVKKIGAT